MATTLAYLTRWLASLEAANEERRREAAQTVGQVVVATRETIKYLATLAETHTVDPRIEARLAREWSRLSHLLRNIGNAGLSKRCLVKGGLWPDAAALPADYIDQTSAALAAVEALAIARGGRAQE